MSDLEYTNTLNKTVLTPRLIFFNQNVIFAIQNSWRKLDTFCAQIFSKKKSKHKLLLGFSVTYSYIISPFFSPRGRKEIITSRYLK